MELHPEANKPAFLKQNWTVDEWNAHSQRTGETGNPIIQNGRVTGVNNSSLPENYYTQNKPKSFYFPVKGDNTSNQTQNNYEVEAGLDKASTVKKNLKKNTDETTGPDGNPTNDPNPQKLKQSDLKAAKELEQANKEKIENNKIRNSKFAAQALEDDNAEFKNTFEGNVLSSVDSPTYHIKLIVVNPADGSTIESYNAGGGVIIAESGVTTQIQIGDLTMNQSVGFDRGRTETYGTELFLSLLEPYGMTLTERLVGVCQELGIDNHLSAGYVVEVSFRGNDAQTGGAAENLINLKWAIPCYLAQVKIQVGNSTTYQMVLYDSGDNQSKYHMLKQNISVKAGTLGEWFTNFEKQLNDQEKAQITGEADGNAPLIPNTFKFNIADKHKDFKFEVLDQGFIDSNPKHAFSLDDENKLQVTFNKGDSISEIVRIMFMSTVEYQKLLRIDGQKVFKDGQTPKQKEQIKAQTDTIRNLKNIIRVDNETISTAFDKNRNDYAKRFEFFPHEYTSLNTVTSAQEYFNARGDFNSARSKLAQLVRNKLLRKRYDHRFTGLNTEVMNVDINLDNLFYVATPMYAGTQSTTSAFQVGDRFTDAQRNLGINRGPGQETQAVKGSATGQKSVAPPPKRSVPGVKFLEEFDFRATAAKRGLAMFPQKTFNPDNIPNDHRVGPTVSPGGATDTIGQIHYNQLTGDMMELSLQIKGDPYWLGASRISRRTSAKSQTNGQDDKYADYQSGANSLLFVMRTPEGYDDETGQTRNMKTADTIAGLYYVYGVEHSFSAGQYTQRLMSYMEDTLTFGLFRQVLESDIPTTSVVTNSPGLTFGDIT